MGTAGSRNLKRKKNTIVRLMADDGRVSGRMIRKIKQKEGLRTWRELSLQTERK